MIDPEIIRYTKHAVYQMRQRRIIEEEVLITLNDPDEFQKGSHSDEMVAIKKFHGKRVRVIYISLPDAIKIITVTL